MPTLALSEESGDWLESETTWRHRWFESRCSADLEAGPYERNSLVSDLDLGQIRKELGRALKRRMRETAEAESKSVSKAEETKTRLTITT